MCVRFVHFLDGGLVANVTSEGTFSSSRNSVIQICILFSKSDLSLDLEHRGHKSLVCVCDWLPNVTCNNISVIYVTGRNIYD